MQVQKHNYCAKCNTKSWAHVFNTTLTEIQSIDAYTSLDGWKAGKMCLAEKCQALTLLKSSKRSRGRCDFSVKKTTFFFKDGIYQISKDIFT